MGDVGHTLVIGPPGAGKSTLVALLVLQFLRYPQARVVIFDKDRSARAATLAVGGQIYEPGNPHAPSHSSRWPGSTTPPNAFGPPSSS